MSCHSFQSRSHSVMTLSSRIHWWMEYITSYVQSIIIRQIKLTVYVMMAGTKDAESQQKGVVYVIWTESFAGSLSGTGNDVFTSLCRKLIPAAPWKSTSVHYCFFSPKQGNIFSLSCKIFLALGGSILSYFTPRTKFHFGKPICDRLLPSM